MAPRTQSTSNSPPPRDTASHMPPGGVPLKLQDALSYFYMVKTKSHDNPKVYDRFLNIIKDFKNQRIGMPSVIEHVSILFSGCGELMQGFNIFLPQGYQIEPMADKCNQDFVTLTTPSGAATQTSSVPPGHCLPESPPPRRGRASAATPVHKGLHLLMPDPDPEFDNCVFFHSSPASNVLESSLGRIQAEDHYAMRSTIPRSIQATASCDKIKQRFASHPDAYEKLLEILPNHRKEERPTTEPSHQDSPLWDFIEIMYSNPVCDFGDDALFGMVTQILNSDTESSGVDAREGLRKKRSRGSTPASEGEESPGKLARQGVKEDGRRGTHRKDGGEWGPWEAILRQSKQGREEGYEMKNEGREDNGPYGEVAHDDQVVRSSYLGGPPLPTCAHGDTIVRSLYPNTPPTPSLTDTHIRVVTHDFAHHHRSIGRTRTKEAPCKDIFQALVNHGMKDISSEIILQSAKLTEGSGFGDVWSGRLRDSTQIALKVWRAPSVWYSDSQSMKRVARELYTWSKIKHDNVQELLGVTMLHGRLGIVSPWMGQGNLREYIHRHPEVNRYQLCIQVATGLSYLHSQSIVHGDLKAANVLVSCDGIAKLNNFDHAIMSEFSHVFSETSYSRANGGTARWMAPELMLGSSGGRNPQADVYALGMTVLEILTGHPPYYPQYKFDAQVVLAVTKQKHPDRPMDCLGDNAQGNQMWNMLVSCWSHDPSARPKSAGVAEIVSILASLGAPLPACIHF